MAIARPLRVGTRGSKLALAQTEWVVKALLTRHPDLRIETVIIRTKGDVIVDRPLREVTGKGFFVKEIEAALLAGEIDFAVHSLKDLPTELPEGLTIAALCNRTEPSDALVVRHRQGQADWQEVVASLPNDARVGTSSLRRQAQLKHAFPHWQLCELRGNVDTRLRKLDEGQYDAIVVAAAGLLRLNLQERIACLLPVELCCPAAGQGVLAVEVRSDDAPILSLLQTLDEWDVRVEVTAERTATQALGAGCHAAVGALARVSDGKLHLWVAAAQLDGSQVWRHHAVATLPDNPSEQLQVAHDLGKQAADALRRSGYR
jgi:hydroxymethylbilane synthase